METILDRFGRIVIPKKIRIKDGVLVFSGVPLEDLGESLTKHREESWNSLS